MYYIFLYYTNQDKINIIQNGSHKYIKLGICGTTA